MDSSHSASSYPVDSCKHNEHHNFPWTWSGWAWYSMWACFFRVQKSWVCLLILKTMPSCPGLTPTLHSTICLTAGSVEHSPLHQRKASHGGHLHFKERTFFLQGWKHLWQQSYVKPLLNLMTSNNPKWTGATLCTLTVDIMWLLTLLIVPFFCLLPESVTMWLDLFSAAWRLLSYKWLLKLLLLRQLSPTTPWGPWIKDSIWGLGEHVASPI